MKNMVTFYNSEAERYSQEHGDIDKSDAAKTVDQFINTDPTKISWTSSLKDSLAKQKTFEFEEQSLVTSLYRPYSKQWVYYDGNFNHRTGQMPHIFPDAKTKNKMIVCKQRWNGDGQLALMTDHIMELQTDGGTQCFPENLYETLDTDVEVGQSRAEPSRAEPSRADRMVA